MVRSTDSNDDRKNEKSPKVTDQEHEPGMRVGEDYQAKVPEMLKDPSAETDNRPEPLLVWAPCNKVSESKMDEFLKIAKDKYGYNMEQSLGMLYWHQYEIDKAMDDLKHFTPLPDEWSMEDKVIFDTSFNSYGKHFPRIRQQLPDKSVGTLVKYYYAWKKNRSKKSLMDCKENRDMAIINGIFADDSNGENESSDSDYEPSEKKQKTTKNGEKFPNTSTNEHKPSPMLSTNCVNCAGVTAQMNSTPRGKMCVPCYDYWRRTGIMRPKDKENHVTLYHMRPHKLARRRPKGMQLNQETLIEVAQSHGDSHVRPLQIELINLKRQIVADKQIVEQQKLSISGKADRYRPPELSQKINQHWTNEELLIAVQCVRRYGKNFQAMSEVLGNKNITQCRNFFLNYRRRYNLMDVLAEYEKENNIPRSETNWEETPDADIADIYPTSLMDSVVANTTTTQVSSNHPPPLRRQTENININDSSQGPPPLVNNGPIPATSSS